MTNLIIVDVQNDFCEGGALPVEGGNKVAHDIMNYVVETRKLYEEIVTTQDWHIDPGNHWSDEPDFVDSWPVHCKAGTWGAELHPAITAVESFIDKKFYKGMYSAAYSGAESVTGVPGRGARNIHVVGLAMDYCVYQTALDLSRYAADVSIITDLSACISQRRMDDIMKRDDGIRYINSQDAMNEATVG